MVTAAEDRTVGSCGKGGLHLLLGLDEVVVLLIVLIGNLCQSRKELVVLGDILRHRTG